MPGIADSGNYAARGTTIRETAKWIAAIFAGAGAVLFSGLSFANVAQATTTGDWLVPVVLAAIPVVAAAWAIREAAAVMTTDPPDTGALLHGLGTGAAVDEAARADVEALLPATVATYGSLDQFDERLRVAHAKVAQARSSYEEQRTADRRAGLESAYRELDELQEGVRDVVLAADYAAVKRRYIKAQLRLLAAAAIAVVGAAASGVVTGRGQHDDSVSVEVAAVPFHAPTRVRVFLKLDRKQVKLSARVPQLMGTRSA